MMLGLAINTVYAGEECASGKSSCDTKCAALTGLAILARNANANDASQCFRECESEKRSCDQQVTALEQEKKQAVAKAMGAKSASQAGSTAGSSYEVRDGQCNLTGFDNSFKAFTERYPQKSNWGTRDTYQYSYFLGTEGLKILQGYKSCLSAADYNANQQALIGARDNGRQGCRQTSSDGGASCQPRYP